MSDVERLHRNLAAVVDDGHDLLKIYIDRARELNLGMFASFRMNDAHVNLEDRGWYGRSAQKLERTDLLLGHPVWWGAGQADRWNFSWQWNYAEEEVRARFLGLFEEVLTRYEFDGLELDFGRGAILFRTGERFEEHSDSDPIHAERQEDHSPETVRERQRDQAHHSRPGQHRLRSGVGFRHRDLDSGRDWLMR